MAGTRRVPNVLWRFFRNQARPLLQMIISLLPPPPAVPEDCRWCSGNRCLGCILAGGEAEAVSLLLRPDDPPDYRKLLTACFVVLDGNAPPVDSYSPLTLFSQREVVQRTIDTLKSTKSGLDNMLCCGYDKIKRSSAILERLTCPAWCLLLERVGVSFMYHLLRWTSIFLPLPNKKYCQVSGSPITELRHRLLKRKSNSQCQRSSVAKFEAQKKRRVDHAKQLLESEGATNPSITSDALQEGSNQTAPNRKRHRPFRWQRERKKRELKVLETDAAVPCAQFHSDDNKFQQSVHSMPAKMPMLCSCCMKLQAIAKMDNVKHIERKYIFHKMEICSTAFPRMHMLNLLKPTSGGSAALMHKIFGLPDVDQNSWSSTCFHKNQPCSIQSSCLYHSLIKLLKTLIWKTCCCQHSRLLHKHCPLPSSELNASPGVISEVDKLDKSNKSCSRGHENNPKIFGPESKQIHSYSSHSQVVSFLWAVLRSIVPLKLLGSPSNWRTLRRNIYKFIELRRFEKFSLKQCLHKIKASKFGFLESQCSPCDIQDFCPALGQNIDEVGECKKLKEAMLNLKHKILYRWMYWIFSRLVVPLLWSNFYVTESEHGKQEVYYYRKSAWKNLTDAAICSLEGHVCSELNDPAVRSILRKRAFGFSKLRFCPKRKGLRMLANLKVPSCIPMQQTSPHGQSWERVNKRTLHRRVKFHWWKSVNVVLRPVHAVLKGLKLKEPKRSGASVSDYNDVYEKLCPFILGLKNGSTTMPDVYVVVCDVKKAYDSVDQDKLLTILKGMITQPEYLLMESSEMVGTKKSVWIRDNFLLADGSTTQNPKVPWSSTLFGSPGSIIIDKGCCTHVKQKDLFSNLEEHVKRNILQFDKRFYWQRIGIPQGSILSSLLCSFYYGHLERNVIFPFLEKTPESATDVNSSANQNYRDDSDATICMNDGNVSSACHLLLRFTDDFLFISTSKTQAARFFSRLRRGFRDYNCHMNEEKFSLSFDVGCETITHSERAHVGEDGISFLKWSGLLINSRTLEVQVDYSRYLGNHLRSSLTVTWQGKPALELKTKLLSSLRPKCHPILFDSNINSAAVVRLNIYQIFVLSAMKFHRYIRELSSFCKLSPRYFFGMIRRALRYMCSMIKRRMRRAYISDELRPILKLEDDEVEWLGLTAFVRVLERKQSRHKQLISNLKSQLSKQRISQSISSELCYAIERSHSSELWKVRY